MIFTILISSAYFLRMSIPMEEAYAFYSLLRPPPIFYSSCIRAVLLSYFHTIAAGFLSGSLWYLNLGYPKTIV